VTVGPLSPRLSEKQFYDYCEQLHRAHNADESTLKRLLSLVGNKAAIEITGLCGYYTMVAMTLNAFGIGTDAAPKN
jgi:4-carboxymuconolactone decarboxylase